MSDKIWEYAELGLWETRSSKLIADELEKHGFMVTRGVSGMPTAFVATWGSGKPVIGLMTEWMKGAELEKRQTNGNLGGTMRLGAQPCQLVVGTKTAQLYGAFVINERHRHRYEFNNAYREKFEKAGFVFSGLSPDGKLVEVIELKDHPFFIASQFHPEFLSKPHQPHPLFKGFIAAAHQQMHKKPL